MSEVIDAASNPDLVNKIVQDVFSEIENAPEEVQEEVEVVPPPDTHVTLPGGYYAPFTGLITEAEVKELTGRDEEIIAKTRTLGSLLNAVLVRGVVSLGDHKPDESMLSGLLAGDREYLLLRIFAATFGDDVTSEMTCGSCGSSVPISISVTKDIPVKNLAAPSDRSFVVECSVGPVKVELPTGITQKELYAAANKSWSELSTILLSNTVVEIKNRPVIGPAQVLDLPIRDRRKIAEEIAKRNPGPQFSDIKKTCPECEAEMEVPLNLASLFQF